MHTLGLLAIHLHALPYCTTRLFPAYTFGTLPPQCNTIMRSLALFYRFTTRTYPLLLILPMILGSIRSFFVTSLYYLSENASHLVPLIDDVALIPSHSEIVLNNLFLIALQTTASGRRWSLGGAGSWAGWPLLSAPLLSGSEQRVLIPTHTVSSIISYHVRGENVEITAGSFWETETVVSYSRSLPCERFTPIRLLKPV